MTPREPQAQKPSTRQRLNDLSDRVEQLETENARLRDVSEQWMMHHAHAAHSLQRVREAVKAGQSSTATLLEIVDDPQANEGSRALVAELMDALVTEWTTEPIPELTRSKVRDWLIAHREAPPA